MKEQKVPSRMAMRLTLFATIVVAVVILLLAWDQPVQERAEAATDGATMSMDIGGQTGKVTLTENAQFTLNIDADTSPQTNGFSGAQVFIDFGATGITYKSTVATWPDCNLSTFVSNSGATSASAGCLSGLINPPPSFFKGGSIFTFDLTCDSGGNAHTIRLLALNDPTAGTSGAGFQEPNGGQIPADFINDNGDLLVDVIFVNCGVPTPTSTPVPPTPTPTISPTPTNTPTPLPPPSERPDVRVTKVDLADPVDSGATYTYRITVESIGLQTAEDIVIEDTLPTGSTYKTYTSTAAFCGEGAGVVTCVTGDMAPTDVITIDIQVNAPSPSSDTLVTNTVTVTSSTEPFANTGNNKDLEQTLVLAPRADVTLEKVGDPTFLNGGEDVTYTLIAKNLGPDKAENVQVVDTLPVNGTFVSSTNPQCGGEIIGQVFCDLGSLAPGGEATVDIVVTAPLVTRSTFLKNTAVVSAENELFLDAGNNLAVENTAIIAPPPDLIVSKVDLDDPVLRLGFYSYDITIENQGLGDALGVVVTDTLPLATVQTFEKVFRPATFVSSVGASCVPVGEKLVECSIAEINVGQQAIVTLNLRAPTTLVDQSIVNNVTAAASDPDENPAGNDASESTALKACYDVSGDLIVDLFNDISLIILKFGLTTNDPGFDVIFDFDGAGSVDLFTDITGVIENVGQNCATLL